MSKDDYRKRVAKLISLGLDAGKIPRVPVKVFAQQSKNLDKWCAPDKNLFIGVGFDWAVVEDVPLRIETLRKAQAIWLVTRNVRKDAAAKWKVLKPVAVALRIQLIKDFRYALRKSPEDLTRLNRFLRGETQADIIEDFTGFVEYGKEYKEELVAIKFDFDKLKKAETMAKEMSEQLALVNREVKLANNVLMERNLALAHLAEAIRDIIETAEYIFEKGHARLSGYVINYTSKSRGAIDLDDDDDDDVEAEAPIQSEAA